MTDSRPFDWDADRNDVCCPEQHAIAVHTNGEDNVVIRQRDPWGDDDTIIVVMSDYAPALAKAVLEAAGHDNAITASQAKDRTGAERQRRYRERHRDGQNRDVTADESVTGSGVRLLRPETDSQNG